MELEKGRNTIKNLKIKNEVNRGFSLGNYKSGRSKNSFYRVYTMYMGCFLISVRYFLILNNLFTCYFRQFQDYRQRCLELTVDM